MLRLKAVPSLRLLGYAAGVIDDLGEWRQAGLLPLTVRVLTHADAQCA